MTTPTDNEALRNILQGVWNRAADNNGDPYAISSPADPDYTVEDAYDAIMQLITRHTQAAEVTARIDEVERLLIGSLDYDDFVDRATKCLAELKAARPGSEGEG